MLALNTAVPPTKITSDEENNKENVDTKNCSKSDIDGTQLADLIAKN